MSSIQEILEQADKFFPDVDLAIAPTAFISLKQVINNPVATPQEVADAYLTQGLLVNICPYLTEYEEDDLGIIYFYHAMQHDPNNISALLNIISSFSPDARYTPYMTKHPEVFIEAYERLNNVLFTQLNELELQILAERSEVYKELTTSHGT